MIEWRTVPDTPDVEVSNTGQTRRPSRDEPIKQYTQKGYLVASIYRNGRTYPGRVNRLVLKAFDRLPFPGEQACHWDGDRQNNNIENLRWGTPAENIADGIRLGRHATGERNGEAKLTEEQVIAIRKEYQFGKMGYTRLGKKYGVTREAIEALIKGRSWRGLMKSQEVQVVEAKRDGKREQLLDLQAWLTVHRNDQIDLGAVWNYTERRLSNLKGDTPDEA